MPLGPEIVPSGVALSAIVTHLQFEVVTDAGVDLTERMITTADVNRPGRQWAGYTEQFPTSAIQVIGESEVAQLRELSEDVLYSRLEQYAQLGVPAVVLTRDQQIDERAMALVAQYAIPILRSPLSTPEVISALSWYLALELAPRAILHAGLVDVSGEGVLIRGRSGIGKSETALELIRRGHRLIADDTVEVRRPSEHDLIGRAPGRMRYFMEVKGIGVVNLRLMYGVGSVKAAADLTMVVSLEPEDPDGAPGLGPGPTTEVLGVTLPLVTIPVRPGRNTAILIETAAMDIRAQRLLRPRVDVSHRPDARVELLERLD